MKILLCVLILLLLPASLAFADEPAQTDARWFWAWNETMGELSSFNAAGQSNVLLENTQPYHIRYRHHYLIYRVNAEKALIILKVDGLYGLYLLTPDHATLLYSMSYMDDDLSQWVDYIDMVSDVQYPYIAFTHRPYLVNIETEAVIDVEVGEMPARMNCGWYMDNINCPRLSADGSRFRYLAASDTDDVRWKLLEFDIATGKTRTAFEYRSEIPLPDDAYFNCEPDSDGEYWFCRLEDVREVEGKYNVRTVFFLVGRDGSYRVMHEAPNLISLEYSWNPDDRLILYHTDCENACRFEIYDPRADVWEFMPLDTDITSGSSSKYRVFDNGRAVIRKGGDYLLVDKVGQVTNVGLVACCHFTVPESRDMRWFVNWSNNEGFALWDARSGEIAAPINTGEDVSSFLVQNGLIYTWTPWVYRFGDAAPLDLPDIYDGVFFEILDDGTLLYYPPEAPDTTESLETGIYRYNPDTGSMTLLLAGATPLFTGFR